MFLFVDFFTTGGVGGGGGCTGSISVWCSKFSSSSLISPSSSSGVGWSAEGLLSVFISDDDRSALGMETESRLWLSSFSGVIFDSLLLELRSNEKRKL